ncbi:Two-component response regulator, YesN/AraC family, consists of REC and AraC-type DNA-binding domains [Paenibacillus sp. UNC496MF]|uniref:response regulator n=1 Tax=Paenibacillus sp. UNC496MF TaxID=1502753 RepID=UPI0008DF78DE|nr:response regulator [Paenibacillus sp. UNC496MF]SFJ35179.1 Two-component response regulator, YesN/AraC family, consists of REC and AraC-type DNA-binding domains [Paenibacillus sp. UNC496MF]
MILQKLADNTFNYRRAVTFQSRKPAALIQTAGVRSPGMKALIVDGERPAREAVIRFVEWERHGIGEVFEAADGGSARRMIREHRPELILVDMTMPGMDGIELLRWIKEQLPSAKTIMMSGYPDFRLVRRAMRAGGSDYLLKPIQETDIRNAVHRAVQLWKHEADWRRQQGGLHIEINRLKPICWEKMFSQLIRHPEDHHRHLPEIRREFSAFGAMTACRCSVLSLEQIDASIRREFDKHHDLLFFALTNVCNEILRRSRSGFAFRYWSSENEIVILHWHAPEQAERIIRKINQCLHQALGARFDIGIGTTKKFHHEVRHAYLEAKAALHRRYAEPAEDRVYVLEIVPDRSAMADIRNYIQTHYFTDISLQQLSNRFHFSREYISRRFKQDFGVNLSDYLGDIRIDKAKQYLAHSSLKVSQIGEMVGYPDMKYFSKVFKTKTGCSPLSYRSALVHENGNKPHC